MEQQFTQYDWALNRAAVLSWEEQELDNEKQLAEFREKFNLK